MTSIDPGKAQAQQTPPLEKGEKVAIGLACIPAAAGAIVSFGAMTSAGEPWFDPQWHAALVPVAVDGAIIAGAVGWIMSVRAGRRGAPWRLVAHLGVLLTVWINYLAVPDVQDGRALGIGLHIGGPIIWSVFVEIIAHHIAKRRRALLDEDAERIPWVLWLPGVALRESARTALRMARTGQTSATAARVDADRCTAAAIALRLALPARKDRRVRRIITRRLATGSLPAADVLEAVGWGEAERDEAKRLPADVVIRRALRSVLEPASPKRGENSEANRRSEGEANRGGDLAPTVPQARGEATLPPVDEANGRASRPVSDGSPSGRARVSADEDAARLAEAIRAGTLPLKPNGEPSERVIKDFLGSKTSNRARAAQAALAELMATHGHTNGNGTH